MKWSLEYDISTCFGGDGYPHAARATTELAAELETLLPVFDS